MDSIANAVSSGELGEGLGSDWALFLRPLDENGTKLTKNLVSDLVSVCFEFWCYWVESRWRDKIAKLLKLNADAIPCDALQSGKIEENGS